jgi:GNAT superfamily N-acetyltransferase
MTISHSPDDRPAPAGSGPASELITIGAARSSTDIETIRGLIGEYYEAIAVPCCFADLEAELAELPGAYSPPHGALLLARAGAEPAGCIALKRLDAESAELARLYVRPAYRGAGLGRALIEHAMAEAEKLGYRRAALHTLRRWQTACRLYRALGFEPVAAFYDVPLDDVLYMARRLEQRWRAADAT